MPVPAELRHYLIRGLQFDPTRRFQSVEDAMASLDEIRSGDFPIQCHVTAIKRGSTSMIRFVERYPRSPYVVMAIVALVLALAVIWSQVT